MCIRDRSLAVGKAMLFRALKTRTVETRVRLRDSREQSTDGREQAKYCSEQGWNRARGNMLR